MAETKKRRKHDPTFEREPTSAYYLSRWRGRDRMLEIPHPRDVSAARFRLDQQAVKEKFKALAQKLCAQHPEISTNPKVLGGRPHIKNTRLSVGTILAKFYLHGTIKAVLDIYEPYLNEEQAKAALAYAQDFLEIACDPTEP
jgi:uncharacterized protein (DUF433 family)